MWRIYDPNDLPAGLVGQLDDVWFQFQRKAWRLRLQLAYQEECVLPSGKFVGGGLVISKMFLEPVDVRESAPAFAITNAQLQAAIAERPIQIPPKGITNEVIRGLQLATEAQSAMTHVVRNMVDRQRGFYVYKSPGTVVATMSAPGRVGRPAKSIQELKRIAARRVELKQAGVFDFAKQLAIEFRVPRSAMLSTLHRMKRSGMLDASQRSATDSGTGGKRTPQVPVRPTKKARQSPKRKRRA